MNFTTKTTHKEYFKEKIEILNAESDQFSASLIQAIQNTEMNYALLYPYS